MIKADKRRNCDCNIESIVVRAAGKNYAAKLSLVFVFVQKARDRLEFRPRLDPVLSMLHSF